MYLLIAAKRLAVSFFTVLSVPVSSVSAQEITASTVVVTRDAPLAVGAYAVRLPVFFPPVPSPLGTAIELTDAVDFRFVAPAMLAAHVGEWYYPALSTLLAEQRFPVSLADRLAEYVRHREQAEGELLARIRPTDMAARAIPAGSDFIARLDALEQEAEVLRRDFIAAGVAWDQGRAISLEARRKRPTTAREQSLIGQILLASAYYRPDLSPDQRALLLGAAIATGATDRGPYAPPFVTTDRRVVVFSPGAARIAVPRVPAPAVASKLERFERLQARLQRELVEAVESTDLASSRSATARWRSRLANQARDLAELEGEAEELRLMFAAHDVDGWPSPDVQWPEPFRSRVERRRRERLILTTERAAAIESLRQESLGYRPGADGKHLNVKSTLLNGISPGDTYYVNYVGLYTPPPASLGGSAFLDRIRETVARLDDVQRPRWVAVDADAGLLGAEAARVMRVEGTMTPAQALAIVERSLAQSDVDGRYALYRQATMDPGLSPIERRLLFALALRRLALPLPGGEFQPRE